MALLSYAFIYSLLCCHLCIFIFKSNNIKKIIWSESGGGLNLVMIKYHWIYILESVIFICRTANMWQSPHTWSVYEIPNQKQNIASGKWQCATVFWKIEEFWRLKSDNSGMSAPLWSQLVPTHPFPLTFSFLFPEFCAIGPTHSASFGWGLDLDAWLNAPGDVISVFMCITWPVGYVGSYSGCSSLTTDRASCTMWQLQSVSAS